MISRLTTWLSHCHHALPPKIAPIACHPFTSTSIAFGSRPKKRRQPPRFTDPYAIKQIQAMRAANIMRQGELKQQRAAAAGDPIRGITTPFVQSFDTGVPPLPTANPVDASSSSNSQSLPSSSPPLPSETERTTDRPTQPQPPTPLNHLLTPAEFSTSLAFSHTLTVPTPSPIRETADPTIEARAAAKHSAQHATAAEALTRILSLRNANAADLTRANIQRCIDTFGRHVTDTHLRPRPLSAAQLNPDIYTPEGTPRAGKDTGSSEVQIAILTAKIRRLADRYAGPGKNDKVNKRNLRLLLHRRQKLLRYMRRKERGSERWTHLVETLGVTEGMYTGQIEVR